MKSEEPFVRVQWRDSSVISGQVDTKDLPRPAEMCSIGWLSRVEDGYIVLSRDRSYGHGSYEWRSNLAIPRSDVLTVVNLVIGTNLDPWPAAK